MALADGPHTTSSTVCLRSHHQNPRHLRLLALEAHDLALTKLERNLQRDRDDVKHLARTGHIDIKTLKARYQLEFRPYLGRPEREDVTLQLWIEMIAETAGHS